MGVDNIQNYNLFFSYKQKTPHKAELIKGSKNLFCVKCFAKNFIFFFD